MKIELCQSIQIYHISTEKLDNAVVLLPTAEDNGGYAKYLN